jgi:hypothetical protein
MEWQPIEAYPYGTKWALVNQVLCANADKKWLRFGKFYPEVRRWYYSGTSERSQWAQVEGDAPTHWMPLPKPPPSTAE